jgi:hypothetical protein
VSFKNFSPGLNPIKDFLRANVESDHVFPVSHLVGGFGDVKQLAGPKFPVFSESNRFQIGQWLLFSFIDGLANVLLKCTFDAGSGDGNDLLWAMASMHIFFTTDNQWIEFLKLLLLRVVERGYDVWLLAMGEVVRWWKARADAHDGPALHGDQQIGTSRVHTIYAYI